MCKQDLSMVDNCCDMLDPPPDVNINGCIYIDNFLREAKSTVLSTRVLVVNNGGMDTEND